jgi:hypothetical protein
LERSPSAVLGESPYWNLSQALAWVCSRDASVVEKYGGYAGNDIDGSLRHLALTLSYREHSDHRLPASTDSTTAQQLLVRALQTAAIVARGRRAPDGRPERIAAEEWAHLELKTSWRDGDGAAFDGFGRWIELRFSSVEMQHAFPAPQRVPPARGDDHANQATAASASDLEMHQIAVQPAELSGETRNDTRGQSNGSSMLVAQPTADTPKYRAATKRASFLAWHSELVKSWPEEEPVLNEKDVIARARQHFGGHISRDWVRQARRAAPGRWHFRGPKSRRK